MWYICTGGSYTAVNKEESALHRLIQEDLQDILISEESKVLNSISMGYFWEEKWAEIRKIHAYLLLFT